MDDGLDGIHASAVKDQIVQRTDLDASLSRVSAVELGYLDDPFAGLFLEGTEKTERRFPIINRGGCPNGDRGKMDVHWIKTSTV